MEVVFFNETNVKIDDEIKRAHEVLEYGLRKLHQEDASFNVINDIWFTVSNFIIYENRNI